MADLPTNFLDDILSASMGGKKKFRLTYRNGTTEEVTIEDISEYDQYGSKFGAGDINKTNQAVNEKFDSGDVVDPMLTTEPGFAADAYQTKLQFDEQNKNMGGLRFGVDGDGNGGYYKADDSFVPFKKGIEEKELWSRSPSNFSAQTVSIDLSEYKFISIVARASIIHGDGNSLPQILKIGESGRLSASANMTASFYRDVSCNTEGVTFDSGYWETSLNNDYCIPIKIYGYK